MAKAEALVAVEAAKATLEKASADADASKLRIDSMRNKMSAKAEARRAFNEADNLLGSEIVALKRDLARLEALPKIVAEMVKPAEKI